MRGLFGLVVAFALCGLLLMIVHSQRSQAGSPIAELTSTARTLEQLSLKARDNTRRLIQLSNRSVSDASYNGAARSESVRAQVGVGRGVATTSSRALAQLPTAQPPLWLRIVLMTVSRGEHNEYLLRALESWDHALPRSASHPLRAAIQLVVINNEMASTPHVAFEKARSRFSTRGVAFIKKQSGVECATQPSVRVKAQVVQQSCDLTAALLALIALERSAEHLLLMEDDWLVCPNALNALVYFMEKASRYDANWMALRVSYGFNGVVVRGADLNGLAKHISAGANRRPPDHLLFEWFSGELPETRAHASGRSFRIFRHNLFYHIGDISTLDQPSKRFTPKCYSLLYDWLLPEEVFNDKECPLDDIWPCHQSVAQRAPFFEAPKIQWSAKEWNTERALAPIQIGPVTLPPVGREGVRGAAAGGAAAGGAAWTGGQLQTDPIGGAGVDSQMAKVTGALGESCERACARQGKRCTMAGLTMLNNCDELNGHFNCVGCDDSRGLDQPAFVAPNAPAQHQPQHCVVNGGPMSCRGAHPWTQRLCACIAIGA